MVKFYIKKVRRLLAVMAVCLVAANASATPFKNIHVQLNASESGCGKVYIRTEDPSNEQTRKSESVTLKATIGENGNDVNRQDGDPLRGLYMIWLYGEPEDGFKLAGFSLAQKAYTEYTQDDFLVSTWTDNGNFDDPFAAEKVDEGYEFIFNANCDREVDAKTDVDGDNAREIAREKNNWSEEPDHVIYAVFVPESYVIPEGGGSEGIKDVQNSVMATQTYTLTGQKASAAHRGIVILNGKKVVRK